MANHGSLVFNEQRLIADLISNVPGVCIGLFQQAKLRLIDLLTLDEASFCSLFSNYSLPFEINQIWSWVLDWRQRNVSICILHLQNCLLVEEVPDFARGGQLLKEKAVRIGNPIDDLRVFKEEIQESYPSADEDFSHVNKPVNEIDDSSEFVLPAPSSSATGKQTTITNAAVFKFKITTEESNLVAESAEKLSTEKLEKRGLFSLRSTLSEPTSNKKLPPAVRTVEVLEPEVAEHFPANRNVEQNNEREEFLTSANSESPPFLSPNHLRALLVKTDYGKQVLKEATTHKLSNAGQKLVVDMVARFHLSLGRKTTAESINDLSEVIIRVFPKKSKDTYYLPKADRSNPGGKVFSRINYIKQFKGSQFTIGQFITISENASIKLINNDFN
ncbi:uncharacterized protein LOC135708504 [Ochlerotatus camptorhynchus]|uniref:uncharacterized protein LOC135708504 n=1 Tax=Ochlerotatus camptorhynchus TaxID=644619 RepID=UPI0031D2768D